MNKRIVSTISKELFNDDFGCQDVEPNTFVIKYYKILSFEIYWEIHESNIFSMTLSGDTWCDFEFQLLNLDDFQCQGCTKGDKGYLHNPGCEFDWIENIPEIPYWIKGKTLTTNDGRKWRLSK